MNEKIKALALQSGFDNYDVIEGFGHGQTIEIESLVKNTVLECAKIIEGQDVDPGFKLRMSYSMKKKFGFE